MKFKRPRGTNDLFGEKMELWRRVEDLLVDVLSSYGYSEIRTPIFEQTELFTRAVGEGTDIVTKEMYTFADKKGRSLTLRPENTAPVMRAYIENGLSRTAGLSRLFYVGPMFRYDRPQAGRYRQFHQLGAEAIGSANPAVDAEIIDMCMTMLKGLGFTDLELHLNSVGCPVCRPRFKQILTDSLLEHEDELCDNCKVRTKVSPLRVFDCKVCTEVKKKLPVITDYLCSDCKEHFNTLKGILRELGIEFIEDPLLVRGLDYYTRTAFEIHHAGIGAQSAICGGGRYDGLAEDCGGPGTPAVGFSAGLERIIETLPQDSPARGSDRRLDVYFVLIDPAVTSRAMLLAKELRSSGLVVQLDLTGRSLKKQLRSASDTGSKFSIILGREEMERGEAVIKDMDSTEQVSVPLDEAAKELRSRYGK
ncbi:MAG: histidine--tRNA ligase [Candidatus Latescibacteria bacterium 4484_7]|nr:MAG: histidine--tRNA ligase [Candidatus Latescibacteria bacterium 4484_7]